MKSLTAVCQTGASMPAMKTASASHAPTLNGRIQRHPRHRNADGENAEMKMYLSKLKDLVPFMPKRKLSKLEIIQHVIDYICELQTELETHPEIGNFDAATALSFANAAAAAQTTDEDDDDAADGHDNDDAEQRADADMLTPSERLAVEAMHQQQQLQYMQHQQRQYHQHQQQSSPATNQRQPLVDLQTPNTILPSTNASPAAVVSASAALAVAATPLMSSLQMQQAQQTTTTVS